MATGTGAANGAGLLAGTDLLQKVSGAKWGAKTRVFRQVLDLSLAAVAKVSGDNNPLFIKPRGSIISKISVVSSVSLTTSQLSFGITGTTAKYGALKAYGTTANAIVEWAVATAMDDDEATADETIIMTHGTADLPSSGIVVIDMEVLSAG